MVWTRMMTMTDVIFDEIVASFVPLSYYIISETVTLLVLQYLRVFCVCRGFRARIGGWALSGVIRLDRLTSQIHSPLIAVCAGGW